MPSTKSRAAKRAATKRAAEAAKKARLEEAAAPKDAPKMFNKATHYEGLPASEEAMEGYVGFENGSLQALWIRLASLKPGFRAQGDAEAEYVSFFDATPEMRAWVIAKDAAHHGVGHTIAVADDVVKGDASASRNLAMASIKRGRQDGTLAPTPRPGL